MRRIILAVLGSGLLFAAPTPSQASPVTFSFTGTITGVGADDLGLGVGVGTAISGTYTFNSAAANTNAPGGSASYQMSGTPYGFSALILGHAFETSDFLALNVVNNNPDDEYGVLACADGMAGCSASADTYLVFDWLLTDSTRSAFAGNALPVTPPSLAAFQTNFFELQSLNSDGLLESVQGRITALTLASAAAAPEPPVLLLLGLGLAALALRPQVKRQ